MEITLLNKRYFNLLKSIQKKFPNLTFQNEGYQYLEGHVKLTDKDKQALKICYNILNTCIHHLFEFNHFKLRSNGDVIVRVQYNWDPGHNPFIGVGYVPLIHLRHGFSYDEHGPIFFQDDLTENSSVKEKVGWIQGLNESGFAGILSNGNIVDRREFIEAVPIQENRMFGIVKPKKHNFTV